VFWKKKTTIQDSHFGSLTYFRSEWSSDTFQTPSGEIAVSFTGDQISPNQECMLYAQSVVANSVEFVALAIAYIHTDKNSIEFMQNSGALEFDGFSFFTKAETFSANFGLSDWEDAMLNVQFSNGVPYQVLLSD
jgi:hypothetical protein